MSTSTPNISLTTFGDITSDQNHLWPSFALSDDENDWDRLQGQRKALDAKIAELERRQMIMEGTEATPKAKGNFEPSTTNNGNALFDNSLSLKVEELNRKYTELEEGLNDAKQKEEDKLAKVEAENKDLMAKFAEMIKEFDTLKKEMNDMKHKEGDKLSKFETEKNELMLKVANLEQIVLEMKGGQKNGTNFENYNSETNIPEINEQNEKKNGNKRDKANAKIIGRIKAKENEKQKSEEKAAELPEKDRVVLLHGTTRDGRIGIAWYFVLLHSHKPPPVLDGAPRLEIDEHGQILFCGWGREPPNDVIKAINTKYGLKFALRKAK